ncbi:MAG TPA: HD-GYP domain-containing protein [Methylomusa anaerophila]|uniref:Cyclic di-GMP phosphodiesterase response regulator RpfG n=1 Tax=Methylomusa anaerophila TaxID=1930071 RepID=A0A348AG99_9FIRM|nr:HD-GYP domain-containing protein [Methylomusa anaerophila]BBB90097.1 cyclic di-GMP phosphodiesterase response regulator RpfG [Methylomusa anaerophila]HML88178.1 HD-GYP domain-containing protein [Methylomusa anaerophila]
MPYIIKQYCLGDVKPGMKLGRDLLSAEAKVVLLSEHAVLTAALIRKIHEWGFSAIDILEEYGDELFLNLRNDQQYFIAEYLKLVDSIEDAFHKTRYLRQIPIEQINDLAEQTMNSLLSSTAVISFLHIINSKDDYTFRHSVNVAVIAGVIGKWLKWPEKSLHQLVLTGLLHDIGKAMIPVEILNKPEKLSQEEMDFMQHHTIMGYELVKGFNLVCEDVKLGILQHHERLDGSGYPEGLAESQIGQFGKIIAVADVYDAMTSNRVYRNSLSPLFVIQELFNDMFGKLDPSVCAVFISNIRESLVGTTVKLSNGSNAKILFLDRCRPIMPLVQTDDGVYIDLQENTDIEIVEIVF